MSDAALFDAARELEIGLIDADLGGYIVKKRVALAGRGKRGGARALLAYKTKSRAFFVYGFAKNVRATVSDDELRALRRYAQELLGYDNKALDVALKAGELIEVAENEQVHPGNNPR